LSREPTGDLPQIDLLRRMTLARCLVVLFHLWVPDCPRFAGRERVVTRRGKLLGACRNCRHVPGDAWLDVEVTP
jgi:hypothetical protein